MSGLSRIGLQEIGQRGSEFVFRAEGNRLVAEFAIFRVGVGRQVGFQITTEVANICQTGGEMLGECIAHAGGKVIERVIPAAEIVA